MPEATADGAEVGDVLSMRASSGVVDLPFEPIIGNALRYTASRNPNTDFVVSLDRRMSYAEIEEASRLLGRYLVARGVGKGTHVGLYFPYSHEFVIAWLAASRIGALVVPLSTIYTPSELGKTVQLSHIDTILTGPTTLGTPTAEILERALPGLAEHDSPRLALPDAPYLRRVICHRGTARAWSITIDLFSSDHGDMIDAAVLDVLEAEVMPGDIAVIVYTSGSTAEPKGVMHTHGAMLRDSLIMPPLIRGPAGDLPPKVLSLMPFFWIGGLLTLCGAVLAPITLLIQPRFEPRSALELMERERGTYVISWPTIIQTLQAHPDLAVRDLSSAPSLLQGPADIATLNNPLPGVPWHRGMSETMGNFSGVDWKIINPETGNEVGARTEGELCVRGAGLMAGYYGRERHEVFDPDGWFHTGDKALAMPDDPRPYYIGRYGDMIKSAGANVAPREVEMCLEEIDGVVHAFVFGLPHPTRGEEVVAIVVPAEDRPFSMEDVEAHARDRLSSYKVPTTWHTMKAADVRWLGSGKPDKLRLRDGLIGAGR